MNQSVLRLVSSSCHRFDDGLKALVGAEHDILYRFVQFLIYFAIPLFTIVVICSPLFQSPQFATSPLLDKGVEKAAVRRPVANEVREDPAKTTPNVPYTVLSKWYGPGGKIGMNFLVSETASRHEVMMLAAALKREYAGRYMTIQIWDSPEALRRQGDASYSEKELYRHFLVQIIYGVTEEAQEWVATERDH